MALTCNSLWLLDDFTRDNGATRIVPGSNHRDESAPETSPDEIQVIAPAGTVVIFDAATWHGGAENRTQNPRRVIHGYFCRSWVKPQLDHTRSYDPEWLETASPLLKRLMGFNHQVAYEEPEGTFRTVTGPHGMDSA
jgi:ectoine hydroxylase-related dioxygenase (phytanoyl-CoA dioxygenase family)